MIKKLLPVIFLIIGTGAGIGAGKFFGGGEAKVESEKTTMAEKADKKTKEKPAKSKEKDKRKKGEGGGFEYLKLTKQFVVPIVEDEEISALVTMSLSLEANSAVTETFYAIEPKLRDGFLQVLFDHANTGGFDGAFTHSDNLGTLRKSLLEVAKKDLGDDVSKVLIMSVSRQDT